MVKIRENFVIDRNGKKTAVILSYREYENLMEDLSDLAIVAERRKDKTVPHDDFLKKLKKDGIL